MNPKRFFAELKRRNVYRATVLYAMSAWLIAQITAQNFAFFNVGNSAVRFVIITVALGFPNAMALAWNT
jgi:adenylate cyclase